MYVIKGFGVIAVTLGVLMILSFVSGSRSSSTASVVIGAVSLLFGVALFFLPATRSED